MGKSTFYNKEQMENFVSDTSDACVAKVKAKVDGWVERYVHLKPVPNPNYIPN